MAESETKFDWDANPQSPPYATFFGAMGAASAMVFSGTNFVHCILIKIVKLIDLILVKNTWITCFAVSVRGGIIFMRNARAYRRHPICSGFI